MIYTMTFWNGSQSTGSDSYPGPLDMAKAIAIAAVDRGTADRVEISDLTKRVVYRYPHTFSV